MNTKIERISSDLQGTTQNLRSLDHMLGAYKDAGREQKSAIDKLRSDLTKTSNTLEDERRRSSQVSGRGLRASDLDLSIDHEQNGLKSAMRGYDSDVESPTSRRRKRRSGSVRFADDMNRELHSIHQSVRDVSYDQNRLEDSFSSEMLRRDVNDCELRRSLRDVSENARNIGKPEPVESSVERRLQAIQNEIKAERHLMDRKYNEVDSISTDLKQALQYHQHILSQPPPPPPPPQAPTHNIEDLKFTKHYLETEALKHKVETELDHIKRQLDHSEGGKQALLSQIEELKSRLNKADQDKIRLKAQLEESRADDTFRDRRRKRELDDEREREHGRFQTEIQDLKNQLSKSIGVASLSEDLRREVERSERQRAQLSDHIQAQTKDIETKEKQYAKVIGELKQTCDKHDESERQKQQMFVQLEDALSRLKDTAKEQDRVADELRMTQQNLQQSERKREDFKGRAQETVKQWKAKCKQLQQEGDHFKQAYTEMTRRNEQLAKDLDVAQDSAAGATVALEKMRSELSDSLAVRADLEEQNHLKDREINELRSMKIEIESEIRDAKISNDRLHHELENVSVRLSALSQDKHQLEDQLGRAQAAHLVAQDQNKQLQRDSKELNDRNIEVTAQLTETKNHMQDMQQKLSLSASREASLEDELSSLKAQIRDERISYKAQIDELNIQMDSLKTRHLTEIQELSKQVKREMGDYEAEIDLLKIELEKEKGTVKKTRQMDEKLHKEMTRLHEQIGRYEEEKSEALRKREKLQLELETQTQNSLEDLQTLKATENELFHIKEQMRTVEDETKTIVERLSGDVDELVGVISEGSKTKYQNRLQWLKREIRSQRKQEKKLQQDLVDTMNVSEKDRSILIQEIEKKEEKMTELIDIKDELMQRDDENLDAVVLLNEKLKDISDQLHIQKLTEDARLKELITVEKKETEVEKAGIEERYTRLKETMRQLQEDLRDTRLNTYVSDGSGDPGSNLHIKNHKNATTKDRTRESPSQIKRRTSPHRLLDDSSNRKHSVNK